jgi:putative ABC transport system permease protein
LSFNVGQRQREIGVRLALGSTMAQIRQLVAMGALRPVITGVAIGWAAAWLLVQFVASFLYGVSPHDLGTFAASGAVLLSAALIAAMQPVRRATGVDPIAALRAE